VHLRVSKQLKAAARPQVGAALGDDVHHPPVAAAVLRLVTRSDEVELLNRLEWKQLQQAADGIVVVVAAVNLIVQIATVAAGNLRRVLRALGRIAVEPEPDTRNRRSQIRELPAVERQALDPLWIDHAADRRGGGLDEWRRADDVDRFGDRSNPQVEVDGQRRRDRDVDVLLDHRRKAWKFACDVVEADGQGGEPVDAFGVAHFRAAEAGRRTLRSDRGTGNARALFIDDAAGNVAGRLLRQGGGAGEQEKKRCADYMPFHPEPPEECTNETADQVYTSDQWIESAHCLDPDG